MAKIVGYSIRENYTFEKDGKVTTLDDLTIHVEQKSVNTRGTITGGKFVAAYSMPIDEVSNIFQTNVKRSELKSFCEGILNKDCFIEKTLVGKNERLAGIEFVK